MRSVRNIAILVYVVLVGSVLTGTSEAQQSNRAYRTYSICLAAYVPEALVQSVRDERPDTPRRSIDGRTIVNAARRACFEYRKLARAEVAAELDGQARFTTQERSLLSALAQAVVHAQTDE